MLPSYEALQARVGYGQIKMVIIRFSSMYRHHTFYNKINLLKIIFRNLLIVMTEFWNKQMVCSWLNYSKLFICI